jgi:glucan phosphoethanolaminetransferase (alkaline phosphatase superfamily)
MKVLIQRSYNHITIAKLTCLALLFSPLWGFWWFKPNAEAHWVLPTIIELLTRSISAFIVYASICLLAFMSFVFITFIRNPVIRISLMIIMLAGWAFELLLLDVNGTLSDQNILWFLWQERAEASELASSYLSGMIFCRYLTTVIILGVVLCASPASRFSVSGAFGLLPIASGVLVAAVIMYTKSGTQTFPIPFGTYSNIAIVLLGNNIQPHNDIVLDNNAVDYRPPRNMVIDHDAKIEGTIRPIFNKIVMIMDESVRGDYILSNGATLNTTPFLNATDHLINFGVAISGSNCSTVSRMIFRFGMRRSDLSEGWREGLKKPTFWQLAHRAGYKTVFTDAWGDTYFLGFGSFLHSGFSSAEKALIDSEIKVVEKPAYLRDHKLVDKILDSLNEKAPTFIYVDKYGVHIPYSTKYPSALQKPSAHPTAEPDLETVVGHYQNAIRWSVDEFFRKLLPAVDLSKTLIVYTSDHGQNLQSGYKHSHCTSTPNVQPAEAYVPILAITSEPKFERLLAEASARGFGRFSHSEIFPTLLLAMGFDASWVKKTYGPSLIDSPSPHREFLIGSPLYQPMMIRADRNFERSRP